MSPLDATCQGQQGDFTTTVILTLKHAVLLILPYLTVNVIFQNIKIIDGTQEFRVTEMDVEHRTLN